MQRLQHQYTRPEEAAKALKMKYNIQGNMLDRTTYHCDLLETGNDSYRFKQRKKELKIE